MGDQGRQRAATVVIIAIAMVLMLAGGGKTLVQSFDSLGKTDRLAAISLIMSGVPEDALPVTFLDIDDATRIAWKAEGSTPHPALAELIRLASANRASAVLVDFDLSAELPGTPPDPNLSGVLRGYAAEAPLLMLVRRINFTRGNAAEGQETRHASGSAATPYDGDVEGKPNIMWVSALNQPGGDGQVRRVRLWQVVCDGASGTVFPSAALAVRARLAEGGARRDALTEFLETRAAVECGRATMPEPQWPKAAAQDSMLPYVFGDSGTAPARLRVKQDGRALVLLRRISAARLVRQTGDVMEPAGEVDADPFEGRVVVIGASYTGNGDVHDTPLGAMPGALVIANSIVQSKTMVETRPISASVINLLSLLMFLVFAILARYLVPVAALVGIFLVSLAGLFAVSRIAGFESGVSMLGAALSGFAVFKLVDMLARIALDVPKRRWRAILKP